MSVIYRFSYDSPVRYLPLVYLLPYDLISRFPTLRRLPRSMGALNASPEWGEVILSQQFFGEITDAVASLVFPHFGFGGWKEHYTGYSPVWRLSYALPLWAKGVEHVVITLGGQGSVVVGAHDLRHVPCVAMPHVADPTAAGDSFVGALAVGLTLGLSQTQALTFASHTAALTVSRMGAMPSLPTLEEVEALLRQRGNPDFDFAALQALR